MDWLGESRALFGKLQVLRTRPDLEALDLAAIDRVSRVIAFDVLEYETWWEAMESPRRVMVPDLAECETRRSDDGGA
jgi:hypothetical protein